MAGRLALPRERHIKQGRDFRRIREKGKRVTYGCLVLNYTPASEGSSTRLGIVTAKSIGGAVQRNRARRLVREAYRAHQHDVSVPLDLVVIARPSISGKEYSAVESDLIHILNRANLWRKPA